MSVCQCTDEQGPGATPARDRYTSWPPDTVAQKMFLTNPPNCFTLKHMQEDPKKPGPKHAYKHQALWDAIIANEAYKDTPRYRSIRELAEEFKVVPATIYTIRTRLGYHKIIEVADNGQRGTTKTTHRTPHRSNFESHSHATAEDLVRSLDAEGIIAPIDRLKMLSRLIRTGSPMIKIAAIKALEDLSKVTDGRVGPPSPLEEEDRVARLGRLIMAVGEKTLISSIAIAFPHLKITSQLPERGPEEALPPNPNGLRGDASPSPLPMSDLQEATSPQASRN